MRKIKEIVYGENMSIFINPEINIYMRESLNLMVLFPQMRNVEF